MEKIEEDVFTIEDSVFNKLLSQFSNENTEILQLLTIIESKLEEIHSNPRDEVYKKIEAIEADNLRDTFTDNFCYELERMNNATLKLKRIAENFRKLV